MEKKGLTDRNIEERRFSRKRLKDQQRGFCPNHGTTDQVFTITRVLEGRWEFSQPVHVCFVDMEKAYNCAPVDILCRVLQEFGMDGPVLRSV